MGSYKNLQTLFTLYIFLEWKKSKCKFHFYTQSINIDFDLINYLNSVFQNTATFIIKYTNEMVLVSNSADKIFIILVE